MPEQLSTEVLITYPVETDRLDIYTQFLTPANVVPKRHKVIETTDIMLQMVASGRGVAALPSWLAEDYADSMPLVPLRLGKKGHSQADFSRHPRSGRCRSTISQPLSRWHANQTRASPDFGRSDHVAEACHAAYFEHRSVYPGQVLDVLVLGIKMVPGVGWTVTHICTETRNSVSVDSRPLNP